MRAIKPKGEDGYTLGTHKIEVLAESLKSSPSFDTPHIFAAPTHHSRHPTYPSFPTRSGILNVIPDSLHVIPDSLPVIPDSLPVIPDSLPVIPDSLPVIPDSLPVIPDSLPVIPDSIGNLKFRNIEVVKIPVFTGMTGWESGMTGRESGMTGEERRGNDDLYIPPEFSCDPTKAAKSVNTY